MTVDLEVPTLTYTDANGEHRIAIDRDTISIGRSPGQDIVLPDPCVSRQHAIIVKEGADFTILDQKSSYGTFVNGVRLERSLLHDGDLLQLGSLESSKLRFRMPAPEKVPDGLRSTGTSLLTSLHGLQSPDDTARPAAHEIRPTELAAQRRPPAQCRRRHRRHSHHAAATHAAAHRRGARIRLPQARRRDEAGPRPDLRRIHRAGGLDGLAPGHEEGHRERVEVLHQRHAHRQRRVGMGQRDGQSHPQHLLHSPAQARGGRALHTSCLGLLYLDSQIGPGHLSEVDHQLLDTIATEAAALLQNALLAEAEYKARQAREELAVAAKIQSGLMSIAIPVLPYAVLQARSMPCLEIGGDFFNAIALDDCLCAGIADVSGKGVSAAIVAATLQGIIHAQLISRQSLPEIAAQLNQFLYTRKVGKYATLVLFKLYQDGRVEYLNCGHIQPLVVRGKEIERLTDSNLIVGLLPEVTYASGECTLHPGDRLLLVTDGLVEAENAAGEPFGDPGLDEVAHFEDIDAILDHVAIVSGSQSRPGRLHASQGSIHRRG